MRTSIILLHLAGMYAMRTLILGESHTVMKTIGNSKLPKY